ncbi:ribonuclease H-like domain-containing protein [Tanacetum coccineum]
MITKSAMLYACNNVPALRSRGRTPSLSFMRPFGCHVTILNTLDYLGKFDGKSDDGFFVGYSMNSKAFRVYNIRTRKVEENLHIRFLEDKPIIVGTNSNDLVGTEESIGVEDEIPPPPPPPPSQTPTQQTPHTVSTIKLPILKKGEYDIWAMKMEHYLAHTDYPIWEVIQRGNGLVSVSIDTNGLIKVLPPKTAEEILARERERKARTTLLMALPEDHLAKFHKMTDAKEMWEAIKSRFGGNDESKKMQKYILKQQFEGFSVSNSEGLHKGYDRGSASSDINKRFMSLSRDVNGSLHHPPIVIQNVAFVSENTSSTNDVSTAYGVSNSSGHNSQYEHTSSYSLLANQSKLFHIGIMRIWNSLRKVGEDQENKSTQSFGDSLIKKCLIGPVTPEDERRTCFHGLQQVSVTREQLGDANIEIQAYTQALKKVEAQLVAHQQGQLWYEEKIRFMKIDLDDKTDVLTYHKKLLAEAEKEKEDLKAKVEKWHNSSKNLNILLNNQMSAKDKAGLGYGDQMNKIVLSYENEVFQSVFVSRTSETENSPVNDRYAEGMHTVPPLMTGIHIPFGPDKEIDDSQFTYGLKQSKPSESDTRSSDFNSCESNCSEETHESMPEPVVNKPKVVSEPKVWSDAPIIEEYESDSEDEHVSLPTKEQEIPSFAFINTDKHVKTPRQTVIEQNTCSQSPKPDKKDCSGLMSKKLGLGFGYTKKACFVCGSFSYLIRDCDFHKKRMAKQAELNNRMSKGSSQKEIRPVWNNVQRMNYQNQFVPKAVLTRTGKILVNTARTSGTNTFNTARHSFNSQTVPINAARKVSTIKPIVNNTRPKAGFHKSVSPFRKSFNGTTTLRTNFSKQKVNTAEVNAVSGVKGKRETAVKSTAGCNWRPKRYYWNQVSKYNGGSSLRNCFTFKDPLGRLKPKQAWRMSRHMTETKGLPLRISRLYNVAAVAFGGSKEGKPEDGLLKAPTRMMWPYVFRNITPTGSMLPRLQEVKDLQGDDLLYYDAEMELTNMILLSIPNEIYNSVDSCKTAKEMWDRAELAHTGSSPEKPLPIIVDTDLHLKVDYRNEEYEQYDVHNHSEDPLASAMLNQAVVQGDRVNIQSRNSGNVGRNNRRAYVQEEVVEGMNATNETANVQRIVRTPTPGNTSTGQCYNYGGKGHYTRNCPKPRVRDSKYFMEQMLLAKHDEAGVILTDEQNDFLFADASRMEEIEELGANICLMARIQPADQNSDDEPSYESAFVSEVQSSSINKNAEQMYPTHTKIINSTIDDDQINSDIQFDSVKGNINSGGVEKDTHVHDLCALETLARNA